jgi:hypothetical protein
MSLELGLKDALQILQRLKSNRGEIFYDWQIDRAIDAIERVRRRYSKEGERVRRWQRGSNKLESNHV